jgi:hypothetical protein
MISMQSAVNKYVEFHTHDPIEEGEFAKDFRIPKQVVRAGDAVHVLYGSDKRNPSTGIDEGWIDYIHDHDPGVKVYRCDHGCTGPLHRVPKWLAEEKELIWLGECAGFSYRDADGNKVDAEAISPCPDLYTVPSGKALLVIQGKKRVEALIWGGDLGVERRGIVG